jgi:hypothetical protein
MRSRIMLVCIAVLATMALVTPATADAGAPMLALVWPCAWVLLIPIILVEALVAVRVLRVTFPAGLKIAGIANLVSTFVGMPLTWVLLVLVQMSTGGGGAFGTHTLPQKILAVTWQSPWLIANESELYFRAPAAAAFLCIPFFFMSVWVENFVARRSFAKEERPNVLRWAWRANLLSYGLVILLPLTVLLVRIYDK